MKLVYNSSVAKVALAYDTIDSDTDTTGAVLDTYDGGNAFAEVDFIVTTGTVTDGTYEFAITECDTANGDFDPVPAYRILGTVPTVGASNDNALYYFACRPTKRYVQLVVTSDQTTDGGAMGAVALLSTGSVNPPVR